MSQQKSPSQNVSDNPLPKLGYKIAEAAEVIGVSESSIRRALRSGELRAVRKLRHVIIPISEIERYLELD